METDPILDSMFAGDEFDVEKTERRFDPKYGEGRWPNAIIRDVEPQAVSEFGHSIMVKADLDPANTEKPMPFAWFLEAPVKPLENGDPDHYEKAVARYQIQLKQIKSLVHATGQWVEFNDKGYAADKKWPKELSDFSTDEKYDKLVNFLRQLVGRKAGLNVKIGTYEKRDNSTGYRKNVWGLDPRKV